MYVILELEDNVGDFRLIIALVVLFVVLFLLGIFGWFVCRKCMRNQANNQISPSYVNLFNLFFKNL